MNDVCVHWCIYYNPTDFPGKYVVRPWVITAKGPKADMRCAVRDSLAAARECVPRGLFCMLPSENDDPVIVETWI